MKYPLAKPSLGKSEERAVLEVLRSGVLSMGEKQEAFEKAFARFVGARHAVAVSSALRGCISRSSRRASKKEMK